MKRQWRRVVGYVKAYYKVVRKLRFAGKIVENQ
jgi:hypothetical protein